MFKFKMTDELTMAKADEDAQRVYAKKLAADRESQKRKRAEESKEQQGNVQYQAGRYISSNEAVWRILSSPAFGECTRSDIL